MFGHLEPVVVDDADDEQFAGQVRGVELTVQDPRIGHEIHTNIYNVKEPDVQWLTNHSSSIEDVLDYARGEGLPHIYNHPYWFTAADYKRLRKDPQARVHATKQIERIAQEYPVLEINHKRPISFNLPVLGLAQRYEKGLVAASDTHSGHIGHAHTLAPGETFRKWYDNVAAGNSYLVFSGTGRENFDAEAQAFMNYHLAEETELPREIDTGIETLDRVLSLVVKYPWIAPVVRRPTRAVVRLATQARIPGSWYFSGQEKLHQLVKPLLPDTVRAN